MDQVKNLKFLFVGGAGRSGTTLVQKVLLSHPEIAGGPEFYFTKHFFELQDQLLAKQEQSAFHPSIDKQKIQAIIQSAHEQFFEPYVGDQTKYIAEKTPTNIEVSESILTSKRNALFLNVHRDGRAVLNSHFQVKTRAKSKGKNLTEIGLITTSVYWSECIRQYIKLKEKDTPGLFNVAYEHLLKDPKKEFKKVFDFLNLSSPENVEKPSEIQKDEQSREAHINSIWYTEEMYHKAYDESRINSWKKELNAFRYFIGSSIMYKELVALEYPVHSIHAVGCKIFWSCYHWKKHLKAMKLFYPILYLKRKLH